MSRAEPAGRTGAAPADPAAAVVASREARLFLALAGLFITNALIAEFVGVKIFALEDTLGIAPFDWRLFGQSGSLSFTAGVMLWPVVFIMTDVINEHFGVRGVRLISWLAVGFIIYAFLFAYLAIGLVPAGWWVTVGAERGVPDMQAAFATIFGQGLWTIGGSVTAFLVGQLVDVALFHRIREATGEKMV
ncbi:MAG TPA: queuosine precursor transporter, partial [Steroidobacteraceae bacterium]